MDNLISCPFCGENDFDLIGLKLHISHGECDVFENLDAKTNFELELERIVKNKKQNET